MNIPGGTAEVARAPTAYVSLVKVWLGMGMPVLYNSSPTARAV